MADNVVVVFQEFLTKYWPKRIMQTLPPRATSAGLREASVSL
jgi:hypothetical protein